jgi:hypothetical protein
MTMACSDRVYLELGCGCPDFPHCSVNTRRPVFAERPYNRMPRTSIPNPEHGSSWCAGETCRGSNVDGASRVDAKRNKTKLGNIIACCSLNHDRRP